MIVKDHLEVQEVSILMSRKSSEGGTRPAQMNMELLTKLRHKKGDVQDVEAGPGDLGRI